MNINFLIENLNERFDIFLNEDEFDFLTELYNNNLIDESIYQKYNSINNVKAYMDWGYIDTLKRALEIKITKKTFLKAIEIIDKCKKQNLFETINIKFKKLNKNKYFVSEKDFNILKKIFDQNQINISYFLKFKITKNKNKQTKLINLIEAVF